MSRLNIRLLGYPTISSSDEQPIDLGSPKTQELLFYLILNYETAIDRRRLAFLFWPRGTETAARRNLRQYIHRLRKVLEPIDPGGALIQAEGHYVQFQPPEGWFYDVDTFLQLIASSDETKLIEATELYRGELLTGLYEEWVESSRDHLIRQYREGLLRLIDQKNRGNKADEAIPIAEKFISLEPYLESGYIRLMRLHYQIGNRGRVKEVYDQLSEKLEAGLGESPLPETTELLRLMLAGELQLTSDSDEREPSTAVDAKSAPKSTPIKPIKANAESTGLSQIQFVSRQHELKWLDTGFERALHGEGRLVLLLGESGVGKTRLIHEWVSNVKSEIYYFPGRGYEFESMIPYGPISKALQHGADSIWWALFEPPPLWLNGLASLIPNLEQYVSTTGLRLPLNENPHHILESLSHFLLTLGRHRPVILFLDNLQWADTATWHFLGYLSQRLMNNRILIIGTLRQEEIAPEQRLLIQKLQRQPIVDVRTLNRFSREESAILISQIMSDGNRLVDSKDSKFFERIFDETEGNPFFIIETVRSFVESDGDWDQALPSTEFGGPSKVPIPLEIQHLIESRLEKLDLESRNALGIAAAIGRAFPFPLLQVVSQIDAELLLDYLDEWLRRGLVQETEDGYDFTHEKISQVAYNSLSRARKQWIHLQVAQHLMSLDVGQNPAQIAHHFLLSSEPSHALPWLTQAGRRALLVRSYAEAREFGLKALGLLGRFPKITQLSKGERISLNLNLVQAYAFTGDVGRARQLLEESERLAETSDNRERLAEIFYRSSQLFWLRGKVKSADNYARRTLRYAEETGDEELRFSALRMLGRTAISLSQFDDGIFHLLRYIDLAPKNRPELPAIYGYLGVAYARVGSWQRAIDAAQTGLDLSNESSPGELDLVARMQLAFVYADLHEWSQALETINPVKSRWQELGQTPHAMMLKVIKGRAIVHAHGDRQGVQDIKAVIRFAKETDYWVLRHVMILFLGEALTQTGALEEAGEHVSRAIEMAIQAGDLWAQGMGLRLKAEIEMQRSKPAWLAVERWLIESRDILRGVRARPDLARTYLTMRRVYDRAGQSAWAVDCHYRATTIFEELGMVDELRVALGKPAGERTGAVVITVKGFTGPSIPIDSLGDGF